MALDESAKAANIIGSIQQYVKDELADVLNSSRSAIDYGGGLPFRDDDLDQWIQVRVMGKTQPHYMGLTGARSMWEGPYTVDSDRGREVYWLLNINCFVRPAKASVFSNLQIHTLRDLVSDAFSVGNLLPVKDYSGTGETIGNMFIYDVIEDRPMVDPTREELLQYNLVFSLRWS